MYIITALLGHNGRKYVSEDDLGNIWFISEEELAKQFESVEEANSFATKIHLQSYRVDCFNPVTKEVFLRPTQTYKETLKVREIKDMIEGLDDNADFNIEISNYLDIGLTTEVSGYAKNKGESVTIEISIME